MSFSEAVRSIRKMRGESMTAFGKHLLVSHAAISYWENGKSVPSWPTLVRLFSMARLDSQVQPILELLRDRFDLPDKPTREQLEAAIIEAGSTLEQIQTRAARFPGAEKRAIRGLELIQSVVEQGGPSHSFLVILRRLATIDKLPEAELTMREIASFVSYKIREFERYAPMAKVLAEAGDSESWLDDDSDEEDEPLRQTDQPLKIKELRRYLPDDDGDAELDDPFSDKPPEDPPE